MSPARPPAPAPRWPTLLTLVVAVAGVHLALLLGPVSSTRVAAATDTVHSTATANLPTERSDIAATAPAASSLPVARVSTVRWIVPPPAALPVEVRATPPASRKAAPARPAATQPETLAPPATVVVEAVPDVDATTSGAEPDNTNVPPAETVALAERAPELAPAPDEVAFNAPVPAPDDEWLAAAAVKKRAPLANTRALPPAQPPASTRLDYAVTGRIKGIGYKAEGALDWTVADGRYSARMEMKVFLLGSRVQTSTGRVSPAGLSPERFADKSRSEKAAHFDAEQNRIRFSNNAPDAVLQPGAQDRLSLFLQIAGLLQARPQAYTSGQTIEMQVAGTGDADIWRFVVGDEVTLSLPAGEVRARQIKRLPRKEFDSTVEMWLAPDLQHLPVRLRVTQANGDVADQQLSRMP
ncbi:MAG: DUF3108 domain-containing protein [Hydrogenophaga sp.]|uniref:DUF3108 domain-containing protein n=1 Tax=Hydrogenophaga sp. TaxID=1904254 RepID=UPI002ABA42F6|nr:DUF3108 domain-containing protein [Hydrogenophaga sp.]MDZ4280635.1 DUF3108 domain-containing protein [Hydrogenophaga sp.]